MNKLSKLTALLLALVLALSLPLQVMAESTEIETKTEYYEVADQILQKMIMAYQTYGEYWDMAILIEEEDFDEFYYGLSQEDQDAMRRYIEAKFWASCIAYTNVAPFPQDADASAQNEATTFAVQTRDGETNGEAGSGNTSTSGLYISKKATDPDNDGIYTISLDAYVTGTVTITETVHTKPMDVVLVLDVSGSMSSSFSGSTSRLAALKRAVNNFLSTINGKYNANPAKSDHRVNVIAYSGELSGSTEYSQIISYASGWQFANDENTATLKSAVNGFDDNGATYTDYAMNQAVLAMGSGYSYDGSNKDRQKVVILFTDGVPGYSESNIHQNRIANVVNHAKTLKSDPINALVYTVAIYSGADPTKTPQAKPITNTDKLDAMLHAASSNYPTASATYSDQREFVACPHGGSRYNTCGQGCQYYRNEGYGYYSQLNFTYNSRNPLATNGQSYYLTANGADSLNNIFQQISNNIQTGGTTSTLTQTTVVRDIVAPSFSMPANASNVIAWTEECTSYNDATGAATFKAETHTATESGLTVTIDSSTNAIDVTGFDFAGNFVSQNGYDKGDPDKKGTYHGSRLVVQFDVPVKPGFMGGNNVPTNGTSSGIYSEGKLIKPFDVPTVNVPIQNLSVSAVPKHIYVSNNLSDNDMIVGAAITDYYGTAYQLDPEEENFGLAAWQVEYVNLRVAPQTAVAQPVTQDSSYSITCTVTPKEDPDEKSIGTAAVAKSVDTSAAIYVYTPEVTFQDSVEKYMDPVTAGDAYYTGHNIPANNIAWVHPTYGAAADTNSPMTGTEPALTFNYTAANWRNEANQVSATADVPVTVTTAALGTGAGPAGMPLSGKQIKYIRIKCDECSSNAEVAGKCELVKSGVEKIEDAADGTDIVPTFVIHVYDVHGKLAISKTVKNDSSTLYAVDAKQKFIFTVTLKNGTTPVAGTYKCILPDGSTGTVTFNNEGVATVELLHGQKITIEGITNGMSYKVEEDPVAGFTTTTTVNGTNSANGAEGNIVANATQNVAFTNTYEVGQLTVQKTITDNSGMYDLSGDAFSFTVTFSGTTTPIGYTVNGTQGTTTNGAATFTLAKNQTATFDRIPAGVTYTVMENTNFPMAGYTKGTETNTSGTIAVNQISAAEVENIYNTGTLMISKTGMDAGEYAVFNATVVARGEERTVTVVVPNGGSAVIKGLDLGRAYKVTEVGDWTWRYTSEVTSGSANGTIPTESDYKATVAFKNDKNKTQWIDGNTYVENVFDDVQ